MGETAIIDLINNSGSAANLFIAYMLYQLLQSIKEIKIDLQSIKTSQDVLKIEKVK